MCICSQRFLQANRQLGLLKICRQKVEINISQNTEEAHAYYFYYYLEISHIFKLVWLYSFSKKESYLA